LDDGKPKQISLIYFVPVSIGILLAFGFALAFAHEIGHGMICNLGQDNTYFEFAISYAGGGEGRCVGYSGNIEVYRAFGGLLASAIALGIAIGMIGTSKKQFWLSGNVKPALPIALICLGFGHLLAATLETFAFDFYLGSQVAMYLIQALIFSTLVIATIMLHRSRAKLVEHRHQ
jgi:hypothetical protein